MTTISRTTLLKKNANSSRKVVKEKSSRKAGSTAKDTTKFGNRYQPPVHLSKEEEKEWRRKERKKRNRQSAKETRERQKQAFEELKQEYDHLKAECESKRKELVQKGGLDPSHALEQMSSEKSYTEKDADQEKKKYGNRYNPPEHLSKEEKKSWIEQQRKERNKGAAAVTRSKKQKESDNLKQRVADLKKEVASLSKRIEQLDKPAAASNNEGYGLLESGFSRINLMRNCNDLENVMHSRTNRNQLVLLSTVSTSLIDEQGNNGGNMGNPQTTLSRLANDLMKDKIHSFACRGEDIITTQSSNEEGLSGGTHYNTTIFQSVYNRENSYTSPTFGEQKGQQDAVTTTGVQYDPCRRNIFVPSTEPQMRQDSSTCDMTGHDPPIQAPKDNRTDIKCDNDFEEKRKQVLRQATNLHTINN